MQFASSLLGSVTWQRQKLSVSYDQVSLAPQGRPERGDWELPLEPGPAASVVRRPTSPEFLLGCSGAKHFAASWLDRQPAETLPAGQRAFASWEDLTEGLQDYF